MGCEAPAIGIDLGTTNSCVAVCHKGQVSIIANDEGHRTTPSCVAFTRREILIGNEAKTRVVLNPQNTIFDSKRIIGRRFDDPTIQDGIENWQFRVVNDCGISKIRVRDRGKMQVFNPEEISAMVLREMKLNAELSLGRVVMDAVISVPACFNDAQRQATLNAARVAGLNVVRLISEPTAAALAYRLGNKFQGEKNVLMFDLGGGKLDVSVIHIQDDWLVKVKSTAGDSRLGGEDFDNILVAHFVEEFRTQHDVDLRDFPKALRRLRIECEYAKRTLSTCSEVELYINCLIDGISFRSKLTKAQFEDMCTDMFRSTLKSVKRALFYAGMTKGSIDEVVLVGGSTRIPKIRELLKDYFDGKDPFVGLDPDEAVAFGAAVQAAVLTGRAGEAMRSFLLVDVAPYSLLLQTDDGLTIASGGVVPGGAMTRLIRHNSQIPCDVTQVFPTVVPNQTLIRFNVYEGELEKALLGSFVIGDFPPAPPGEHQVEVRFQLDSNGILYTSIETPNLSSFVMSRTGPNHYAVDEMLEYAARRQSQETENRERKEARKEFVTYVYAMKQLIEYTSDDALTANDRDMAIRTCESFLDWLDENPLAETNVIRDEIEQAEQELSDFIKKAERERKS